MAGNRNKLTMEIAPVDSIAEIAVLRVAGFLDSSGIVALSGIIDRIISENKNYVIVDMSAVEAIGSAALGEFMGYRRRFVELGGDIVFAGLAGSIRSKLTVLGANRIFSFYPDVRAAINAYKWDHKKQSKVVTLTFPPFLKLVPPVRQLASRLARQYGYSTKDAFRIETIVDEVCNNAIEHGRGDIESEVVMQVAVDKEKVDITVTNRSDPEKVAALKDLIGPAGRSNHVGNDDKRGRGLALIRMLSSNMEVNINERGTSVHVIKLRED